MGPCHQGQDHCEFPFVGANCTSTIAELDAPTLHPVACGLCIAFAVIVGVLATWQLALRYPGKRCIRCKSVDRTERTVTSIVILGCIGQVILGVDLGAMAGRLPPAPYVLISALTNIAPVMGAWVMHGRLLSIAMRAAEVRRWAFVVIKAVRALVVLLAVLHIVAAVLQFVTITPDEVRHGHYSAPWSFVRLALLLVIAVIGTVCIPVATCGLVRSVEKAAKRRREQVAQRHLQLRRMEQGRRSPVTSSTSCGRSPGSKGSTTPNQPLAEGKKKGPVGAFFGATPRSPTPARSQTEPGMTSLCCGRWKLTITSRLILLLSMELVWPAFVAMVITLPSHVIRLGEEAVACSVGSYYVESVPMEFIGRMLFCLLLVAAFRRYVRPNARVAAANPTAQGLAGTTEPAPAAKPESRDRRTTRQIERLATM